MSNAPERPPSLLVTATPARPDGCSPPPYPHHQQLRRFTLPAIPPPSPENTSATATTAPPPPASAPAPAPAPTLPARARTTSRHTQTQTNGMPSRAPSTLSLGNISLSLSTADLKKAKLKSLSTDNFLRLPQSPVSVAARRSASGLVSSSAKSGVGGGSAGTEGVKSGGGNSGDAGSGGREVSVCGDGDGDDDDFDPTLGVSPFSPFYIHPMTVTSLEQLRGERQRWSQGTRSSDSNTNNTKHNISIINNNNKTKNAKHIDLEAGLGNGGRVRSNLAGSGHKEWPSGRTSSSDSERWEFAKTKKKRGLLAAFSPRLKLLIKIVIAVLLVCAMLGIGLGLSVAVNGSVWTAPNQSKELKIGRDRQSKS